MKTRLIRIGNSRGVRIPKALVEQCGLGEEVELTVAGRTLVVAPARRVREGWDQAFAAMAAARDDAPLLPKDMSSDWDEQEWTW